MYNPSHVDPEARRVMSNIENIFQKGSDDDSHWSFRSASPAETLGGRVSIDKTNFERAAKKEAPIFGDVGNFIARVYAGAVGGPLYAASFLIGGGLTLAVILPTLLIAAPPALLGAGIGAAIGAALTKADPKMAGFGALVGAAVGGVLQLTAGAMVEGILEIPKALVYNTIGRLGAGLCAFAATGKFEAEQLEGEKYDPRLEKVTTIDERGRETESLVSVREKSTNEKLLDALYLVSLPEIAKSLGHVEGIFESTKQVEPL